MPSLTDHSASESGAWTSIDGTWRQLHGSFDEQGLSIEWHDFRLDRDIDWGRSFHPGSLEVCLNFSGAGALQDGDAERAIGPGQVAIYTLQDKRLRAVRSSGSLHRFLTLEFSQGFLQTHFGASELPMLKPPIARFIEHGAKAAPYLEIRALPAALLASRVQFLAPPVPAPARNTWYLGRVLEILAQTIYPDENPEELFCKRHQRGNRERVERVRYLIERDLENPPSLDMLAQEVGCSPFYLSRVFTQETGASIPKFLRLKRLEKAAELLRTGRANVTEAAFAGRLREFERIQQGVSRTLRLLPGFVSPRQNPGTQDAGLVKANQIPASPALTLLALYNSEISHVRSNKPARASLNAQE